jgi:hypothetical protein
MRWSAPLHYTGALGDHPSDTCLFPGTRGWSGKKGMNVLCAIWNVTGILEDSVWRGEDTRRSAPAFKEDDRDNDELKFLIHFIGDMEDRSRREFENASSPGKSIMLGIGRSLGKLS